MSGSNDLFDDVLHELMLEGSRPSYEALLRWCERYPQYRDELEQFFTIWAVQQALPERSPIDEERFGAQAVKHARAILRRQGLSATPERVAPPADETKPLKEFDQYVLTAIYLLRGEGYAVSITEKVDEMTGKENLTASTFAALSRLEGRGLVESREKEAPAAAVLHGHTCGRARVGQLQRRRARLDRRPGKLDLTTFREEGLNPAGSFRCYS